ncbi:MAG TPA: hypothetical protein VJH55_02225 [Candidatus Paceibacterota bacterium]
MLIHAIIIHRISGRLNYGWLRDVEKSSSNKSQKQRNPMNTLTHWFGLLFGSLLGINSTSRTPKAVETRELPETDFHEGQPLHAPALQAEIGSMFPSVVELPAFQPVIATKTPPARRHSRGINIPASPVRWSSGGRLEKALFQTRNGNLRIADVVERDGNVLVLRRGTQTFFRSLTTHQQVAQAA